MIPRIGKESEAVSHLGHQNDTVSRQNKDSLILGVLESKHSLLQRQMHYRALQMQVLLYLGQERKRSQRFDKAKGF